MTTTQRPRVLFVDDDEGVLSGLRTLLRRQRATWDMAFAGGGPDALALLAEQPCDVVVSDMRMPRMDGAAFLDQVRERWPGTVRVVLTGEADRALTMRAIPVAQQWLTKPCSREQLVDGIEKGLAARRLVADGVFQQLIGRSRSLPVAPATFERLTARMRDPGASLADIARIVEANSAMAAKILQLANSALFRREAPATTVQDAIAYIGLKALTYLVLGVALFEDVRTDLADSAAAQAHIDAIEHEAMRVSRLAGRLLAASPDLQVTAATAGILHGAGALVLLANDPARFQACAVCARERGIAGWEAERLVLGASHAELGGALLSAWGVPSQLVLPIAHHHTPERWGTGAELEVAAALFTAELAGAGRDAQATIRATLAAAGLAERTDRWLECLHTVPAQDAAEA